MPQALIYIVDDDEAVLDSLRVLLEVEGFDVRTYSSGEAFLGAVDVTIDAEDDEATRSCLLLDMQMPGMSGLDVIDAVAAKRDAMPIIVMTGAASPSEKQSARERGALRVFDKPLSLDDLYFEFDRIFA